MVSKCARELLLRHQQQVHVRKKNIVSMQEFIATVERL